MCKILKVFFFIEISLILVNGIDVKSRIVGGFIARANQFPFQVSLQASGTHICSGSIINKKFIVTAANCVTKDFQQTIVKNYTILAGTNSLLNGGVTRKVQNLLVHPKYDNRLNDIALLELNKPLKFSKSISSINVTTEELPVGSMLKISGWGRIEDKGPISNKLKFNYLSLMEHFRCGQITGIYYEGVMCLSHSPGNGACNGDFGGPAIYNGQLFGISNFVAYACGTEYPDGYLKVSYYADWILENTGL